ncbi:MAG: hypothetical protein F4246_13035 [Rhodothermaceae bacterium]|nr:hypothetical protein [Rhodothermaceae bacterium]MXX58293.1 hypothetical protein [Rhodothermaceae bacterium]MYD18227.1 hypothetical protein [Rhodothermaceae bacterium]MYD57918.1 hypothetical protein [Rhodothermaceae bacterium]MYI44603.1 hypothetical protein [Rhodothermaceae bacterium]
MRDPGNDSTRMPYLNSGRSIELNLWRRFLEESLQTFSTEDRIDPLPRVSDPGIEGSFGIYKQDLEKVFADRSQKESLRRKNSNNAVLHELMFCCDSPAQGQLMF